MSKVDAHQSFCQIFLSFLLLPRKLSTELRFLLSFAPKAKHYRFFDFVFCYNPSKNQPYNISKLNERFSHRPRKHFSLSNFYFVLAFPFLKLINGLLLYLLLVPTKVNEPLSTAAYAKHYRF